MQSAKELWREGVISNFFSNSSLEFIIFEGCESYMGTYPYHRVKHIVDQSASHIRGCHMVFHIKFV